MKTNFLLLFLFIFLIFLEIEDVIELPPAFIHIAPICVDNLTPTNKDIVSKSKDGQKSSEKQNNTLRRRGFLKFLRFFVEVYCNFEDFLFFYLEI